MLLYSSKNGKAYQPAKQKMMKRLWTVTHQKCQPPWLPFFPVSRTGRDTTTSRLPATLIILNPTLQVRLLCQRGTTRLWHRSLLHTEMEPSPGSGFATSHRRKRLRQANGGLLLSLCLRPNYMAIQASLTMRNHVLETVKIWKLWSPYFTMLPGSQIDNMCSNTCWITNPFGKWHCPECQEPWQVIQALLKQE